MHIHIFFIFICFFFLHKFPGLIDGLSIVKNPEELDADEKDILDILMKAIDEAEVNKFEFNYVDKFIEEGTN